VVRVDTTARDPRLDQVELLVACDVDSPLFGPEGAAQVYGPQKGANADAVWRLDHGLEHLAALVDGQPWEPGAGAAGGLAFGLAATCGARLVRGAELVFEAVGFHQRLAKSDLVMVGEGRLDLQSLYGKVVGSVACEALRHGIPGCAVVGTIGVSPELLHTAGLSHWVELCDADLTEAEAMARAAELIRAAAARIVARYGVR
jgi:glycerate kinase